MVLCGDLAPGEGVSEAQLSDRLDMGKAPVRNALARLLQESLVQVVPRSGYIVAPLTLKDVHEIIDFRMILETAISEKAVGRVDADSIRKLDKICQVGYTPGDRDSQKAFLKANQEIHMTIARATQNQRLVMTYERLLDDMFRMLFFGMRMRNKSDEWKHGHGDLLSALMTGDSEAAMKITRDHLISTKQSVIDAALESPSLTDINLTPLKAVK
jgi:DNA-binding GntR family transcriptional regulator